ncbi:MAG: 16S rRNA (uracil(1498)-N(3))-methyltransferase [Sedimenticola thiotaurini]|uniref:Ribosomal RNA small subunit methyltransferase E n=1 Tax=Sedimenticola thiotaurini TaxID=1543721 RepID=A0A558DC54_9GAMM|nr:MAG: 16S rRNA (uracil(1498)-N(3))-methyltransferase [Sedimenticola thiotaurini]
MQLRRIHTHQLLIADQELLLEEGPARHLTQVLRLKPETEFILFNGDGYDYQARLIRVSRREVLAQVIVRLEPIEPNPAFGIHLGIGISKGERMDFAIQKAVELGVTCITPLVTEHCVVRINNERQEKRLSHWLQVIIAACEQSQRRRVPTCREISTLDDWIRQDATSLSILLDHRSEKSLHDLQPPKDSVRLLVGPEGGFSEAERDQANNCGFSGIRLGPRVLRTETAPLTAIAAIQTLWGDFR